MDQQEARQITEDFLMKHLADNNYLRAVAPLPEGTEGELAGPFELEAVDPGAEPHVINVRFLANFRFRFTDPGLHFRANSCLGALHRAHPEMRAFKFEISVRSADGIDK